jgi:hypothetical protein
VVRAATIRGVALGATRTVSRPGVDTVLADADAGPRGEAVVLGRPVAGPPGDGRRGLEAVTRAAGARFGAPEQIAAANAVVDQADVAIDARSAAVFATWRGLTTPIGWSVRTPLR